MIPGTPRDESDEMSANIITGPWKRDDTAHFLFGGGAKRQSFRDLATLAGSFGDALDVAIVSKSADVEEAFALSVALDEIAFRARKLGYKLNKSDFLNVAIDAEKVSETLVHLAMEIKP